MTSLNLSRRRFIQLSSVASGSFVLAFNQLGLANPQVDKAQSDSAAEFFDYIIIAPDNTITLFSAQPEIGQGVKTALPMIIAEELEADWSNIQVKQADIDPKRYKRQAAGGSQSVNRNWHILRQAGAGAKAMLIQAAAEHWGVAPSECYAKQAHVYHRTSKQQLVYGQLAPIAALLPAPDVKQLSFKSKQEFSLLGKRIAGVDNVNIVTGKPLYGVDKTLDNMAHATFVKAAAIGAKPTSANLKEIKQLPGVLDAFMVEGTERTDWFLHGVAIIASDQWSAFSAAKQLKVKWNSKKASQSSSREIFEKAALAAKKVKGPETLFTQGQIEKQRAKSARLFSETYVYPYIAHAPLEPMNCTVDYSSEVLKIWAPMQIPHGALNRVKRQTQLPEDKIEIYQTRAGGGFGRRLANDYVLEAVAIAQKYRQPFQYIATREQDTTHDLYRPGGSIRLSSGLDENNQVTFWQEHFITFAKGKKTRGPNGRWGPSFPVHGIEHFELSQSIVPCDMPYGALRAPQSNGVAFPIQCFLHELSVHKKQDHLAFLLELLGEPRWTKEGNINALHTGRAAGVLKLAAQKAGWDKTKQTNQGRGIAFYFSHQTVVAEVVDVTVTKNKQVTVNKITLVADAGPIMNLSGAEAQCEGAAIDALGAAFTQQITFTQGQVEQQNFDTYPLQRITGVPDIEVHFIQSDFHPTGLGEPTYPPLAPALANAIFDATGQRVRELPLSKSGYVLV